MHSQSIATTSTTSQVRSCSNARRVPLRVLLLAVVVMTSLQQVAFAAPSVPRTKTRTLDPWMECLRQNNGTFQYIPKAQFDVPQGFKDQLIPAFQGSLMACGQNVLSNLFLKMNVNRTGTPAAMPFKRTADGVMVGELTPGDYVLSIEAFLTRTPEQARNLRNASSMAQDKPLPPVQLVPLGRPKIMQPFRILAITPNAVPATQTFARVSTLVTTPMLVSFGANVNNQGPNMANWTCCATGAETGPCGGACPEVLRKDLGTTSNSVAINIINPSLLPVGLFRVTLKVGPANVSFIISVENVKVVPIDVFQDFDPRMDAYVVFAKTMQEAQVQWQVNGVNRPPADGSGRSLVIPRMNLSTTMPTEVTVKATLKDGTNSIVKLELAKVLSPTVMCTATNAEKPSQNTVTALNELVLVRAVVGGVPADASITYNFGFGRAPASAATVESNAAPVFVTSAPILTNEFNVTAPPVPVATATGNFQVPFFVDIVVNGQIKLRAACPLAVNPPVFGSPALADVQVKQQQAALLSAADSGDNSAMINAASNAMGLAVVQGTAKTDETARRQLENNVAGNMATALRRTLGKDGNGAQTSDMSAELKVNALDCLSQMSLAPLKAGAAPPPECNTSCVAQLRQDILDVVASAIAPGTDGARIDMKTYGTKVLDVLSNVAPGKDSAAAARSAAVALAGQVTVGQTVMVASTDGKTKVAGTTIPATLIADLTSTEYNKLDSTSGGASMSFPAGVMITGAGAGSTVSLAATTFTSTPFTTASGLPENYGSSSATTDFAVALDGTAQTIANLGIPIKAELTRTSTTANVQTIVRYYDETTSSWSSAGISDVTVDATTGRVSFKTTHLTAFSTFDSATTPATPVPPTTTAAGGGTGTPTPTTAIPVLSGDNANARSMMMAAVVSAAVGLFVLA